MKQQSVLVIGAGFMGAGIAQVCAQSGYRVHLNDVKPEALGKAEKGLRWSVNKLAEKGFLQEDPDKILSRLTYETDLSSAAEADWIIEAILEVEAIKIVFIFLDRYPSWVSWRS